MTLQGSVRSDTYKLRYLHMYVGYIRKYNNRTQLCITMLGAGQCGTALIITDWDPKRQTN